MDKAETALIEGGILTVRGVRVILDSDLAKLYGVRTKRLNEQYRRNRDRFPEDFAFQLTAKEVTALRSQIATSLIQATGNKANTANWSQFATSSSRHRASRTARTRSPSTAPCKPPTF